jgi:hypothetical protein
MRAKYWGFEIQVLRAKYWGLEIQVLRAKCSNAGLQARADCVRSSRVPTSIMKGINIFTANVIKDFPYSYDKIIQVLWKKGNKEKKIILWKCLKWCHMALWDFRLCFEPSCLPPLTKRKVFGIKLGKKTFTHTHKASTWPRTTSCAYHMCRTAGWRWVFDWWSILNCGFFGLSFVKSGDKMRNQETTVHRKQKRGSNWFSHLN